MRIFNLLMILFGSIVQACFAQTDLPKELPTDAGIYFYRETAMQRSRTKIQITANEIVFEEFQGSNLKNSWKARILPEDLQDIYQKFRENNFEKLKNEPKKSLAADSGSEEISLSLNKFGHYRANLKLLDSDDDRKVFEKLREAILTLAERYKP